VRVCFATYPTAFQQPGGGEAVILALREALQQRGVEVTLFDPWSTRLREHDLLHYFSSIGAESFPKWRSHVPLIVTPTLWPHLPRRVRAVRRMRRAADRMRGRRVVGPFDPADVVLPHSRTEAELLTRNYGVPLERIVIIPHGTDERFAQTATGAFARENRLGAYVLCAGRIDPVKNQLRLIRALRDSEIYLAIVGDAAPGAEAYSAECRRAAGPRTRFIPALPRASELLIDAVAGAACVVIPSIYEIWSLIGHEAGIAGTAIASSRGGALPELLGPYPSYFDPRAEDSIRNAVLQAVDHGPPASQAQFFSKISWAYVADRAIDAYQLALTP
jgi:glycosyltransferase involved in cell wall biosynthesis